MKQKLETYLPLLGLLIACAAIAFCFYVFAYKTHDMIRQSPVVIAVNRGALPDKLLTPGEARSGVTKEELCDPSFRTGRIRNVSGTLKEQVRARYGMTNKRDLWCNTQEMCEIDHLVPLLLGGSNAITNLFPQAYEGEWNAHHKDQLEMKMKRLVCAGKVDLTTAQAVFKDNWIDGYKLYIAPQPRDARRGEEGAD